MSGAVARDCDVLFESDLISRTLRHPQSARITLRSHRTAGRRRKSSTRRATHEVNQMSRKSACHPCTPPDVCRRVVTAAGPKPKHFFPTCSRLKIAPSDPQASRTRPLHPPCAMGTAASSISSHTGSPYTPKSTSTNDRTTGAHRGARARGALARLTRPLTAARAHHVHRACQRRCPRPGSRRGCEAAHIVQLLRAHAIITVTRTYGMKM